MSAIEDLRAALAAGPTPGPWDATGNGIHKGSRCVALTDMEPREQRVKDAAYIAAACNAAPELLAEVDRQREVIRSLTARCDHLGMSLRDIKAERDALRAEIDAAQDFAADIKRIAKGERT